MVRKECELPPEIRRDLYIRDLKTIQEELAKTGIKYVIVGGIPLRAILGQDVQYARLNSTTPDFDTLGLGPNAEAIEEAEKHVRSLSFANPLFPDVSIEPATFSDKPQHRGPILSTQFLSGLRINSKGQMFLTYRDVEEEIPPETMSPVEYTYGGISFPSLPAKTIWYRYLVRGGLIKPKDEAKLDALADYIRKNCPNDPPDELYKAFIAFSIRVYSCYPHALGLFEAYWKLDQLLDGLLSGSKILYNLKNLFTRKN